jgi:hypothetical protein
MKPGRILVASTALGLVRFVAWRSGVHREFSLVVELPSMDVAVVTRVELGELALERGTGNVIYPARMGTGAMARAAGVSRKDLGLRQR